MHASGAVRDDNHPHESRKTQEVNANAYLQARERQAFELARDVLRRKSPLYGHFHQQLSSLAYAKRLSDDYRETLRAKAAEFERYCNETNTTIDKATVRLRAYVAQSDERQEPPHAAPRTAEA
jgi:regulator of protease activity HflC (stomatin/prohibitin superfamily)